MPTPQQEYDLQRALAGLRVTVQKRMTAALRVVAEQYAGDPTRFRDTAIGVVQNLTRDYGAQAGEFAAAWYNAMRLDEGIRGRYVAQGWIGDYDVRVAQTVRRAVGELFEDAPDVDNVFSSITDRASKYVTDTAHETIRRSSVSDPQAHGWRRVAHGETCDFCLVLVGRGGVYTRSTVLFKSHTHCNCTASPEWDSTAHEVPTEAYMASARTQSLSAEQRQIMNDRLQAYIEQNRDELDALKVSLNS